MKRRRSPVEDHVTYAIKVARWDYHYGFGIAGGYHKTEPYSGVETLEFFGDLVRPEGLKYPHGALTLYVSERYGEARSNEPAKSIGLLDGYEDCLRGHASVPADRFSSIIAVCASGRVQLLTLSGKKLRYRKSDITNVGIYTEFNEEDW